MALSRGLVLLGVLLVAGTAAALTAEETATEERETMRRSLVEEMRASHPVRGSNRDEDPLEQELASRARLFLRAVDSDRDRRVGADDVLSNAVVLEKHLPGVSPAEFASFIDLVDTDGDRKLDEYELMQGLSQGVEAAFVESHASTEDRRGFFKTVKTFFKKFMKGKKKKKPKKKKVDESQDACVICQYVVERAETNVKQAGVIPAITGATMGPSIFLETGMTVKMRHAQTPFDTAAASVIGATRQSTRYQRQLERQKYNEIYRVMDITLDDICEQGMPNKFYGYCLAVYQTQSDIVDGLRYQYRPTDICFKIGMCGKKSYITKGIHSRYSRR